MICFLTSSPCFSDNPALTTDNGFAAHIISVLPTPCRGLFICSSPDDPEKTDLFSGHMKHTFSLSGLEFVSYTVLDSRNEQDAAALIAQADFIILAGGHVPTQNRFFRKIGLRKLLEGYNGVIMGISAGTMNSADVVYAQPEMPGEATDPDYEKFLPGLGLTDIMICPHYQMVKDDILDGLRLFEDITYTDSVGRQFYALPDGSYLYIKDGVQKLYGEAYLIKDGTFRQISKLGDILPL
jgi:dipeptidase E